MAEEEIKATTPETPETTPEAPAATADTDAATDTAAAAEPERYAKSGKKSKKHIEEVKAEEARQARKAEAKALEEAGEKPKGAAPVTRPKIERRGKKYQAAAKLVDKTKTYNLADALDLAVKTNPTKFAATVEAHVRLNVDPRQADQNIRATVVLPHGKTARPSGSPFLPRWTRPRKPPQLVPTSRRTKSS